MNNFSKIIISVFILLLSIAVAANAQQKMQPHANPDAIIKSGHVRFTVLSSRLIRMEWDDSSKFVDRASLAFIDRKLKVPEFKKYNENGNLVIDTGKLRLIYKKNSGKFSNDNLHIQFKVAGKEKIWHPGMKEQQNLKGTFRTLDGVKGAAKLPDGLLSRDGWHLVDDSQRPLFDDSDWPWVLPRKSSEQDWYFFGYGHAYKQQLKDFTRVAGKIPMPPRYAFGIWWSRWWAYTDQELKDLYRQFQHHDIPLSVMVIDMDWHKTWDNRSKKDQAGQSTGWTGYTWNPTFFPAPRKFLGWAERNGIKNMLNLHPASGIQPYEKPYPQMAEAMGMDSSKNKYVPFQITDKKFAKNYFKYVIDPKEKQGIDFWWLDWQQWSNTKIPGVTPTFWLNYVFYTHMQRQADKRPMIYHRYGGLGNQRYQIGFSGDAISVWSTLNFQPYFTATASNVGYGYWAHDMGGFYGKEDSPELYTRWLQWGIFSPMVKSHVTKDASAKRRIWTYPYPYAKVMRNTLIMRYKMVPYIYTASREAYDSGISILRPMYYSWPGQDKAYQFKNEYMFGDDLLVNPVTQPMSANESKKVPHSLAEKKIWLPKDDWVEWFTGASFQGDTTIKRQYALDQIPVFAKKGAIIPMQTSKDFKKQQNHSVDPLVLTVFAGDSASVRLYEDAGNSEGYKKGKFTWTKIIHREPDEHTLKITIQPANGSFPGSSLERAYKIRLLNTWPAESVRWNGREIAYNDTTKTRGWQYDGNNLATIINVPESEVDQTNTITVHFENAINSDLLNGMRGNLARLSMVRQNMNALTNNSKKPIRLINMEQMGRRIELHPDSAYRELKQFHKQIDGLYQEMNSLNLNQKDLKPLLNLIKTIN